MIYTGNKIDHLLETGLARFGVLVDPGSTVLKPAREFATFGILHFTFLSSRIERVNNLFVGHGDCILV